MSELHSRNVHLWISWAVPVCILVASVVHASVVGYKLRHNTVRRRKDVLRIFVAYLVGGISGWLAVLNLFLPSTFLSNVSNITPSSRRVTGFAWLAFSVAGIISAANKSVNEQRVAIAAYTVFTIGVTGVELYRIKGHSDQLQIYNIPVVKFVVTIILVLFASITRP